ncbi:hypothetical protein MED222_06250 [Vibrio sp. MED222]|nr:hypothetical protein MED222_06250 [Vibrio sp. MED222]
MMFLVNIWSIRRPGVATRISAPPRRFSV